MLLLRRASFAVACCPARNAARRKSNMSPFMRHSTQTRAAGAVGLVAAAFAAGCTPSGERDMPTAEAAAVVRRYCTECHNADDLAGDIDFKKLDPAHVEADRAVWETAVL